MISNQKQRLFFRTVPNSCSLRVLKSYFKGVLKHKFSLQKGKNKGKRKSGYAIIIVSDPEDVQCLLDLKHYVEGNELVFQKFKTDEELFLEATDMLQKRIYISNFPIETTKDDISLLFSQFGKLEKIFLKPKKIMDDLTGDWKLVMNSFVNFEQKKDAKKCLGSQPLKSGSTVLNIYQKLDPKKRFKDKSEDTLFKNYDSQHHSQQDSQHHSLYHSQHHLQQYRKNYLENSSNFMSKNKFHLSSKQKFNSDFKKKEYKNRDNLTKKKQIPPRYLTYRRRGGDGNYVIKPFQLLKFRTVDWMGKTLTDYFSLKFLVPQRIDSERFIGWNRKVLPVNANDVGYDHNQNNIRLNKSHIN